MKYGFRSGLEEAVGAELQRLNIPYSYEEHKLAFEQPAKKRSYTPDFIIPNGIIIETKGRFVTADRQKHLMIAEQFPLLEIRFVFSNPNNRIGKGSKTTYAMWCDKHGFTYAAKTIPRVWLKETLTDEAFKETKRLLNWTPKEIT